MALRPLIATCCAAVCLLLSLICLPNRAHGSESTPPLLILRIADISGAARLGWPVRGGVPLSRGRVTDLQRLSLRDEQGVLLPLQATALARWPDGSVKWVLLNSSVDVPAGGQRRLDLCLLPDPAPAAPLLATQSNQGVAIQTATLRLTLPHPPSATLWQLAVDHNRDGRWSDDEAVPGTSDAWVRLQQRPPGEPEAENWLRDASDDPGAVFHALADPQRTVTIEENGPLHAAVRLDGWHADADGRRVFPYTLRIHAWRDSARLQFQHTFVASEDVRNHFVREMAVQLPGAAQPRLALVGQGPRSESLPLGSSAQQALSVFSVGTPRLYHLVPFTQANPVRAWIARSDEKGQWTQEEAGEMPRGWAAVVGERGAAVVAMRDFDRMHPKELRVDGSGMLQVYLWPQRGGKCLDLRRRDDQKRAEYVENDWDPYAGRGVAVTHAWWVDYGAPDQAQPLAAGAQALATAVNQDLRPIAAPQDVAATGAFGEFLPAGHPGFARLDAALAFAVAYLRQLRHAFELDGMIDWGDVPIAGVGAKDHMNASHPQGIPFRGYNGWANNDFAIAHGLFLHYLRTGDPHALLDAEAMTRHVMDVDTIHYYPENPELLGHGRRHDQQHWGNGPRSYCFAPFATIDYFLLTGDRRAYDVAKLMADHPAGYGRYSTVRFWEISGDDQYRESARRFLAEDLAGDSEGWPLRSGQNFRSNSYDGVGYTFFDSILPDDGLTRVAVAALRLKASAWTTPWMNPGHPTHLLSALAHRAQPTQEHTQVLKAMVWSVGQGKVPQDAAVFNLPRDAPFEQWVSVNQSTLQIGRADILSLYYLVGLPRVMARLAAVNVDEQQCLSYEWKWVEPDSFEEVFDPGKIRALASNHPARRHEYDYYTTHDSPSYRPDRRYPPELVARWEAAIGRHRLYEDNRLLGPHPWPRTLMGRDGLLGWTRRLSNAVVFTTTDNSDARSNGRTYKLVYTSEADERWQDVPAFDEVLDPRRIVPLGASGRAWACVTEHHSPLRVMVYPPRPDDDARWLRSRARHQFLIDGKPQGPMADDEAWGRFYNAQVEGWGRSGGLLMFTLPAGIDPRTDGRRYELIYDSESATPPVDVKAGAQDRR
jgi:hypothetical protein